MIARIFVLVGLLFPFALKAQDSELTNYKSGISLNFGDSATTASDKGAGYMEEYLYFDKVVSDRKIVYIKSATAISMSHNERNRVGHPLSDEYIDAATDVGTIKYKVDGDQSWGALNPTQWTAYSAPISFDGLNYGLYGASGTAVVGTTGRVGSLTRATKTSTYYRGIAETVGTGSEEWHTLTVADDDTAWRDHDNVPPDADSEYDSSDGKVFLFVVNPKVPAMTWRVTGTGQFYTTPPKKYYIPKIYAMTTYLQPGTSGTVAVEIRDINGGNISYKINGGSTVNVGATNVTLSDSAFSNGSNTLEYWITSTPTVTRTRTVVKNPAFPSAGEAHGDRFWISADHWAGIQAKLEWAPSGITSWMSKWESAANNTTGTRDGRRNDGSGMTNALVARKHGMTRTRSGDSLPNAQFAKRSLFEHISAVDPVGLETNGSNVQLSSREWFYRGYYDVNNPLAAACAYDILIGHYRTDQGHATGISPIEDYYIRDALAHFIHTSTLFMAGYIGPAYDDFNSAGMWETSRMVTAAMKASVMPNYSTPYFGTCGLDGNTTTYADCPFPDQQITWRDLLIRNAGTVAGFPNQDKKVGVEDYMLTEGGYATGLPAHPVAVFGDFTDKPGYASTPIMGHIHAIWWNLQKLYNPDHDFALALAHMDLAARGQAWGIKSPAGPINNVTAGTQNAWFPAHRAYAEPIMLASATSSNNSWSRQTLHGGPYYVLWYDHDLPLPDAAVGTVATPTFASTLPDRYETTQSVTLACATDGATIYYRINGGSWLTYSTALSVSVTTLIESYATKAANADSAVLSGTFAIAVAPVSFSPGGGSYGSAQTVALSTSTSGASILYSVDGSEPSVTYSSPLLIAANATPRAKATKAGLGDSAETSATYEIGTTETTAEWSERDLGAVFAEPFIATFTARMAQPGSNLAIGLAPAGSIDDYPDLACIVRFTTQGFVDARNGGVYAAVNVMSYSADTDYVVVMTVNPSAKTYSATVNGTTIAANYAFRTEHAAASSLTAAGWRMTNPDYTATISGWSVYLVTPPVRATASPRGLMLMP